MYLLNQVTEQDLMALAEAAKKAPSITPTPTPTFTPTPSPTPAPSLTAAPLPDNNKGAMDPKLAIPLLLAGVGIAVGYYFKSVRPKRMKHAYNSEPPESGGDDNEDGIGEGFNYEDKEIPYDRDDDPDDDWND